MQMFLYIKVQGLDLNILTNISIQDDTFDNEDHVYNHKVIINIKHLVCFCGI